MQNGCVDLYYISQLQDGVVAMFFYNIAKGFLIVDSCLTHLFDVLICMWFLAHL